MPASPRIVLALVLPFLASVGPLGCRSAAEYRQAKAEFDQLLDETAAKAETGYQAGKAIHDAFMAEDAPLPTSIAESGPWLESKIRQIDQADAHFADVQLADSSFAEKAYETHLMSAAMGARLGRETFALEQTMPATDYYYFHRSSGIRDILSDTQAHYDAWDKAGYAESYPELGERLAAKILDAESQRDAMQALWEQSLAIGEAEPPADGSDDAAPAQ